LSLSDFNLCHLESDLLFRTNRCRVGQLRQDPKRTQLYQPDPPRSRYLRNTSSPQASPAPSQTYHTASADPRNPAFSIDKYEPRQPNALTLRPVITPGNNPDVFYQRKALAKVQSMPRIPVEPQQFLRMSIPNNMIGPNIYLRCLYGLRSGIEGEQDFALHHLVKVSYERGDKYKFEGFPFLAEALLEKALEISELVYGVKWLISYEEEEGGSTTAPLPPNTLNAAYGTPDLLGKLESLKVQIAAEDLETTEFSRRLEKLNEAALVLRNMVILEENAVFLSKFALFKDFLTIAVSLPPQPRLTEFRHYALEMAEQVTRYWPMPAQDPLYLSMLPYLESSDRGMILSAMRAINRIGIETPEVHRLTDVPRSTVERLVSFMLFDSDNELVETSLDFLYEYTAIPENVTSALSANADLFSSIMPRLTNLLLHNAVATEEKILNRPTPQKPPVAAGIPLIPAELHHQLLQFQEPERSSRWLRCCFEESPQDDITQIAIWQAYQGRFAQNNPIPAAEFIKNVSNTFATAQAQVINGPTPRFIIKGIRPRRILIDLHGRPFFKCLWEIARPDPYDPTSRNSQRHLCSQWHSSRQNLWSHVLQEHLRIDRTADGRFTNTTIGNYTCRWTGCMRISPFTKPNEIGVHVRSHLPESAEAMSKILHEMANGGKEREPEFTRHTFYYTAHDERGHACGIPFMSVMVMRNLARYANKYGKQFERNGVRLMDMLFTGVMRDLWYVVSVNRTLREWLGDLINIIEKGEREARRGVKREHDEDGDFIASS